MKERLLNLIVDKYLTADFHGQLYQRRLKRAFDKKVLPCSFQVGDLVLKRLSTIHLDPWGKWTPNYKGPFIVKNSFSGGDLILTMMDGDDLPIPMNSDIVKNIKP